MRRSWLTLVILILTGLTWYALRPLVLRGSERFFLLFPLCYAALFVTWNPHRLRERLQPTALYLGGLLVFSSLYGTVMTVLLQWSPNRGWTRIFPWREALIAAWFLLGIKLLCAFPWTLVRAGVARVFPAGEDGKPSIATQILPLVLMVPLLLPWLIGLLYVHRFKIENHQTPESVLKRSYEEVEFQTTDGQTIRAWWIPAEQSSSRTVLLCHGLAANRGNFLPFVEVSDRLEANTLMFDFRGHGNSDGHTISMGYWERLDVFAAIAWLRQHRLDETRQLYGLGISMGSSALVLAGAESDPPLDGYILDSPFAVGVELTDRILRGFPAQLRPAVAVPAVWLASVECGCPLEEVRPIDFIGRLRAPVLLLHAEGDPLIPAEHSRRLFERAAAPRGLEILPAQGHGHALFECRQQYLDRVSDFFRAP